MAKRSGGTRNLIGGNTGGYYRTVIDEDTGERIKIWTERPSAEKKKLMNEFEKYNADVNRQLNKLTKEKETLIGKIIKLRDEVRELNQQRKSLLSDMEDELSRDETTKRRDWYGRQLDKIDEKMRYKRNMYSAENVNYNTTVDKIKRLNDELEKRGREYREQLKRLK